MSAKLRVVLLNIIDTMYSMSVNAIKRKTYYKFLQIKYSHDSYKRFGKLQPDPG